MKKVLPYEITVRRVTNGYILIWREDLDGEYMATKQEVIEEDEHIDDIGALQQVLWEVMDHFGIYTGLDVVRTKKE